MRKLKLEELNRISPEAYPEAEKNGLILILDNIRSMHNVGSVFRSSDAFRIEAIYLCGITPQPPHREIRKTAIGAEHSVTWHYEADSVALAQRLKEEGYQILSVEQTEGSTELEEFKVDATQKYAIVLGHEVEGVKQEIINLSSASLEIPQYGSKHSLNVSVATGIVLYHFSIRLNKRFTRPR